MPVLNSFFRQTLKRMCIHFLIQVPEKQCTLLFPGTFIHSSLLLLGLFSPHCGWQLQQSFLSAHFSKIVLWLCLWNCSYMNICILGFSSPVAVQYPFKPEMNNGTLVRMNTQKRCCLMCENENQALLPVQLQTLYCTEVFFFKNPHRFRHYVFIGYSPETCRWFKEIQNK